MIRQTIKPFLPPQIKESACSLCMSYAFVILGGPLLGGPLCIFIRCYNCSLKKLPETPRG